MLLLQAFGNGGGPSPVGGVLQSIPIIGGLLSGLFSLFGGGGPDPIKALANWSANALQALGNWISEVFNWALKTLIQAAKFIGHTITGFFKGVFSKFFSLFDHIHSWLESKLGPLVAFIKKIRAWYDRVFKLYFKPYLNMLQHIRQYLAVLRALHVKWAQNLDRRILQIESYTGGLFLQVRSILNGFVDILNSIIDPLSIIRKPTIVLSTRRTINAMIRVSTGRPPGYFFPSPRKNAGKGLGVLPSNFVASDPSMNPPASSYLGGNDGLGAFMGFTPGAIPDDGAVDDLDALDYFDDSLWPDPVCDDPVSCAEQAFAQMLANPLIRR